MGEDTYKCGGAPLHAGLRRLNSVTFVDSQCCACVVGALSSIPPALLDASSHASLLPSLPFHVTHILPAISFAWPIRHQYHPGVEDSQSLHGWCWRAPTTSMPHHFRLSTRTGASWAQLGHLISEFIIPFSSATFRFKKIKENNDI